MLSGEGSFNSTSTNPWEHLLNSNVVGLNNNVANGLRYAWEHLQNNFQIKASAEQLNSSDYLLTQGVSRAGFYHDGSTPKSATAAITIELEKARMNTLRECIELSLPQGHYERASFESWQSISAVPLTSYFLLLHLTKLDFKIIIAYKCLLLGTSASQTHYHYVNTLLAASLEEMQPLLMSMEQIYHRRHYLEEDLLNNTMISNI
jgi:hypothetical protein